MKYDHSGIEAKWQKQWGKGVFHASNDSASPNITPLINFHIPAVKGSHVGHQVLYSPGYRGESAA